MSIPNHTSRAHRFLLLRQLHARPRLWISVVTGMLVTLLLPRELALHDVTRMIIGWNTGAILYLLLAARMMFYSTHEKMRSRARQQDEGRWAILILVMIAALATLGAIIAELSVVKDMHSTLRISHVLLTALTIATSWAFTHLMFALHYAHDYYIAVGKGETGGLAFPDTQTPDYGDFLYFACVIGTSGQTADVSFTSPRMRRIGLLHCVLAFFFNTTLLALTINIASGLM